MENLKMIVGFLLMILGMGIWIYADNKMKGPGGKAFRFFFPVFGPDFFPSIWIWLLGICLALAGLFLLK